MKKSVISIGVILVIMFSLVTVSAAERTETATVTYRGIKIVVNGEVLDPVDAKGNQVEPFILKGTTYLPVRAAAAALGLSADWSGDSGTVILTSDDSVRPRTGSPIASSGNKTVKLGYRDIKITLNGNPVTPTDANGNVVEPFIISGTTYLPVRGLANALSIKVGWDDDTSTVSLGDANMAGSPTENTALDIESKSSRGIRTEFKEAMDSYEAFFDEYCTFMKAYSETDDITSMLAEYARYMSQYADTMDKLEKLESWNLSTEETSYYIEVLERINQKLTEVMK